MCLSLCPFEASCLVTNQIFAFRPTRSFALKCGLGNSVFVFVQHCTGHTTTGSGKGIGNQHIHFARVLYCKLLTIGKQLPAFPLEALLGTKPRPQSFVFVKQSLEIT